MNTPDYLPDYLTPEQREAILHRGSPLLIIAGPGSGKTGVITWRVAHLVRADYVRPENLLVTTFTNKAALELKDRVQQKLPEVNAELMRISTLHAFCADLLRRYRRHTPFSRGFRILDDPLLPPRLRPLVLAAIAYFILPADVIPEDIHGPYGYVDDIFLCAFVADILRRETGSDALLEHNWDGEGPILPLIADILAREKALIGEEKERILAYIGFAHLKGLSAA